MVDATPTWEGSFERETFTVALGDLVRELVPALLGRPEIRQRYEASTTERVLARFDLNRWGRLDVMAVGPTNRFVLHATHDEFELVLQAAFDDGLDALRIAQFRGNLTSGLVWCRSLSNTVQAQASDGSAAALPRWTTFLN
ncbi:MAG: hypothetical protein AAF721_33125 [Myxococcota bacterium]